MPMTGEEKLATYVVDRGWQVHSVMPWMAGWPNTVCCFVVTEHHGFPQSFAAVDEKKITWSIQQGASAILVGSFTWCCSYAFWWGLGSIGL